MTKPLEIASEPGMLRRDSQSIMAAKLFGPIPLFEPYGTLDNLFSSVRSFVVKYWDFADERGYDVFSSWIMATYLCDRWDSVPFVFFLGNPGTGKTRGLEVAQALAFQSLLVSSITTAALFRIDEDFHPTLCLDETEYLSSEDRREIVGLINSRYRRGSISVRMGERDESGKIGYDVFNVYGFTALAGTRGLLQSLESRCIIFYMQRAARKLPVTIDKEEAAHLRGQLFQFQYDVAAGQASEDFKLVTKSSSPLSSEHSDDFEDFPGISGRSVELFTPLLAVSPPQAKDRVRSYALDLEVRKNAEISASDDALVYFALKDLHELPSYSQRIPLMVLRDKVGEGFGEKEGPDCQHIGYSVKRMGLQTVRGTAGRKIVVYDDRIMMRLARQFGEGTLSPEKPSKSSNPSLETKSDGLVTGSKPSLETASDDRKGEPSP